MAQVGGTGSLPSHASQAALAVTGHSVRSPVQAQLIRGRSASVDSSSSA
jgi:hypothetical protein